MSFKLLVLILFSLSAYGFDKDFTATERVPLEFVHLFESMKVSAKTSSEQIRLVGICKEIDDNLGSLKTEHIFFLLKSEVIKNVLEYKHKKVRNFDITTFLITRLEQGLKRNEPYLSPFSRWISRSIIAELKYRESLGLITSKSFNPGNFDGPKKAEAVRFSRYLTYLLPWIDKMESLAFQDFNELTKEVSWVILDRLNQRSILFKQFAKTSAGVSKTVIFNIPQKLLELHPEDIKRMQSNESDSLTLKEKSEKSKSEATKQVQGVSVDDMSTLSEEVSKELEQKTP